MTKVNAEIYQMMLVLEQYSSLREEVRELLMENVTPLKLQKGELLMKSGDAPSAVYFVRRGALRGFIDDEGKDITTWITAENEFVASISGLDGSTSAVQTIEAIEDCDLVQMPLLLMEKIYELYPETNRIGRILFQQYYMDAERRALIVRYAKAEQRYKLFLEQYGHLSNRIPLKFIASFLGITIETLSRVRRKILH